SEATSTASLSRTTSVGCTRSTYPSRRSRCVAAGGGQGNPSSLPRIEWCGGHPCPPPVFRRMFYMPSLWGLSGKAWLRRLRAAERLTAGSGSLPIIAAVRARRNTPCPAVFLKLCQLGERDAPPMPGVFIELFEPGFLRNLKHRVSVDHA